jgi:hypothetical protein
MFAEAENDQRVRGPLVTTLAWRGYRCHTVLGGGNMLLTANVEALVLRIASRHSRAGG